MFAAGLAATVEPEPAVDDVTSSCAQIVFHGRFFIRLVFGPRWQDVPDRRRRPEPYGGRRFGADRAAPLRSASTDNGAAADGFSTCSGTLRRNLVPDQLRALCHGHDGK